MTTLKTPIEPTSYQSDLDSFLKLSENDLNTIFSLLVLRSIPDTDTGSLLEKNMGAPKA